jgi:hypothetical protein
VPISAPRNAFLGVSFREIRHSDSVGQGRLHAHGGHWWHESEKQSSTFGRSAIVALLQKGLITLEQLQQSDSVRTKFAENFKPLANRRSINCWIRFHV